MLKIQKLYRFVVKMNPINQEILRFFFFFWKDLLRILHNQNQYLYVYSIPKIQNSILFYNLK